MTPATLLVSVYLLGYVSSIDLSFDTMSMADCLYNVLPVKAKAIEELYYWADRITFTCQKNKI